MLGIDAGYFLFCEHTVTSIQTIAVDFFNLHMQGHSVTSKHILHAVGIFLGRLAIQFVFEAGDRPA